MILLIVYLVGCLVSSLILVKWFLLYKGEFLVGNISDVVLVGLFSWVGVVALAAVIWGDRIKNIVLWKRK